MAVMTLAKPLLVALMIPIAVARVDAADCDCQQHKAGATGTGTCSLSEDASRCSITYSASSSALKETEALVRKFGLTMSPLTTFMTLNQTQPGQLSKEMFRDLFINALSLTAGPATATKAAERLQIERPDQRRSGSTFDDLYRSFGQYGCFDYREGSFRFLLISRFSQRNGSCAP